jgi:hypothetical protein
LRATPGPREQADDIDGFPTVPTTDDDSRDDDWPSAGDDGQECTAFCPDCGAEVYDDADVCPKCFSWLNGETARHAPRAARRRDLTRVLVVVITIAAILLGSGILWFVR